MFRKRRIKYPKVEQVPFYKENGSWIAELSYCDDKLENMQIGEDELLDALAQKYSLFHSGEDIALYLAINQDWPQGSYFRLDFVEEQEISYYVASGPMVEALGLDGYKFPFSDIAKKLFGNCPESLFVYGLM